MSERLHHHNPAARPRSRPTREKESSLSNSSARYKLRTPRFYSPPCLGSGGSRIAGSRRLPLFPRKEGQTRAELFDRKQLTVHADFPLEDIACPLLAQTKDATIVCVIGCQIARTRIHTLLKCLASACHDNREKIVLLPECTLQTKQSVKTKEVDDVFSRHPLYCGRVVSDAIGCRRPTGCVFVYMLQIYGYIWSRQIYPYIGSR